MDLDYHNVELLSADDFSKKVGVSHQYIRELFNTKQLKFKQVKSHRKTCLVYWWEFINTKQTRIY